VSVTIEDRRRSVVPRWRSFSTTTSTGQLDAATKAVRNYPGADDFLAAKRKQWELSKTVETAAELVSAATVLVRESDAQDAATFIVDNDDVTPHVRALARRVIAGAAHADTRTRSEWAQKDRKARIRYLKKRLYEDPRSAIAWVDLAREYTILGQLEPAFAAMHRAVVLSPTNRFVLRSAARFLVHAKAPDEAHDLLKRAPGSDPWVVAAEIATATITGRTPRQVRRGRELLASGNTSPFHITELAAAIGTLEFEEGRIRTARKLFVRSLEKPTDNTVAQVAWASRRRVGLKVPADALDLPYSYEARAWEAYGQGNWNEVVEQAQDWLLDEPFSVGPAMLGSFVALTALEDFSRAERLLLDALLANPHDPILLNNLAVALANQDKLAEADIALRHAVQFSANDPDNVATLKATQGLLAFRRGAIEEGRALYMDAIEHARRHDDPKRAVLAILHLLREELHAHTSSSMSLMERFDQERDHITDPVQQHMMLRLEEKLRSSDHVKPVI
jgi:tetratricopeptide (TPR) repeat protein